MGNDAATYTRVIANIEQAVKDQAELEGQRKQILTQLLEQFGCRSYKEAKALLANLEAEHSKAENTFNRALHEFKATYADVLGDL